MSYITCATVLGRHQHQPHPQSPGNAIHYKPVSQSDHEQLLKVNISGGLLDNQTWQTECSTGQSAVV